MTRQEDIEKLVQKLEDRVRSLEEGSVMDAVIYPLHGSLPPELQLKSLDLPGIDILKFDFLDPPSYASLDDALSQLYLIDAIDENGAITSVGRTMVELSLELSLSRTLIVANDNNGSLSQALKIAAMLSTETSLLPNRSQA
uniref:RNA helicase n=1 Tax=Chenopodium quinoa TaxID=63459 RepID=A0A803M2B2_CHEQI